MLATIGDAFGETLARVVSVREGVVIGKQNIPLVQEGDAMFHIAYFRDSEDVSDNIEELNEALLNPGEAPL